MNKDMAVVAERPINRAKVADVADFLGFKSITIYRRIRADHQAEGLLSDEEFKSYKKQFPMGRLLPGGVANTYSIDWDAGINWKPGGDGEFGQHTPAPEAA